MGEVIGDVETTILDLGAERSDEARLRVAVGILQDADARLVGADDAAAQISTSSRNESGFSSADARWCSTFIVERATGTPRVRAPS